MLETRCPSKRVHALVPLTVGEQTLDSSAERDAGRSGPTDRIRSRSHVVWAEGLGPPGPRLGPTFLETPLKVNRTTLRLLGLTPLAPFPGYGNFH